jgi:hypothetical protein
MIHFLRYFADEKFTFKCIKQFEMKTSEAKKYSLSDMSSGSQTFLLRDSL